MPTPIDTPDWSLLPAPTDDGAARHLTGLRVPSIPLPSTDGTPVDLSTLPGLTVVYAYPRTGTPDAPNPPGWDAIPGARGCTPQTCSFRDLLPDLRSHGLSHLFGLSTQPPPDQLEAARRLHLPFPLLSDASLALTHALRLPTFTTSNLTLLKRLTLILDSGLITHVLYPVFPPDRNASDVLAWLQNPAHPRPNLTPEGPSI